MSQVWAWAAVAATPVILLLAVKGGVRLRPGDQAAVVRRRPNPGSSLRRAG